MLPAKNQRDLHEIEKDILDAIEVVPVETLSEVLDHALMDAAAPRRRERRGAGFVLPVPGGDSPPINARSR